MSVRPTPCLPATSLSSFMSCKPLSLVPFNDMGTPFSNSRLNWCCAFAFVGAVVHSKMSSGGLQEGSSRRPPSIERDHRFSSTLYGCSIVVSIPMQRRYDIGLYDLLPSLSYPYR